MNKANNTPVGGQKQACLVMSECSGQDLQYQETLYSHFPCKNIVDVQEYYKGWT